MYDRPYMTAGLDEKSKKTLIWIIGLNLGVFVLQNILNLSGAYPTFRNVFALTENSIPSGFVWAPVTYSLLHGIPGPFHVLINMLGVFFLGRALLPVIGQKRFAQLYLSAAVVGGLLWYAVSFISGSHAVVGASGAVLGLLTLFACMYPDREMHILLFFILPVKLKPKYVAWTALFISAIGMFFMEMASNGDPTAHSAHLGGMLGGYLFYKFVYAANPYDNSGINLSIPKIFRKSTSPKQAQSYHYNVNVSKPRDLKREVDRILDKINSKGFGSLSAEEKKILDDAKDLLRKR